MWGERQHVGGRRRRVALRSAATMMSPHRFPVGLLLALELHLLVNRTLGRVVLGLLKLCVDVPNRHFEVLVLDQQLPVLLLQILPGRGGVGAGGRSNVSKMPLPCIARVVCCAATERGGGGGGGGGCDEGAHTLEPGDASHPDGHGEDAVGRQCQQHVPGSPRSGLRRRP